MALKPDLVKFMQDIIRIPSLSSEEGAVVERIREEMLRIGYDEVTVDPMGNCHRPDRHRAECHRLRWPCRHR